MLVEFCFDLRGVPDQIEFVDLLVFMQRHNGAGNKIRRAKVTAHRIEGDLHRCETLRTLAAECKVKILFSLERQHLAPTIVAARRADDVRRYAAAALWAFVELRGVPAVCGFPRPQPHL